MRGMVVDRHTRGRIKRKGSATTQIANDLDRFFTTTDLHSFVNMNANSQRQSSIWSSSSSAKQIHALGEVEKDIARLLHTAATALSLLTVPQADPPDTPSEERLPDGEERAEMFVQEATKYYETLNSVQKGLRKAIANLREARISSASIAPSAQTALLAPGVNTEGIQGEDGSHYALQESLVERDAWLALAQTLESLPKRPTL
ncbi:hypothetical protein RhiJN_16121 [Ceratobasidium sp. AG-Ba]|nr:hypothetical protein RhiJN_16121 [Ceratobasidium sp. AG-Ba]